MRRTRVKICGVMRPEDAAMAAACGADAIGLIFHPPSPRNVSVETGRRILAALPSHVMSFGLFVDSPVDHIRDVCAQLGLRHVQLHGNETPEMVAELQDFFIIKAVRVVAHSFVQSLDLWRGNPGVGAIVLETGGTREPGGTGIANDWELVSASIRAGHFKGLPPIIAAGGLNPRNVAAVVQSVRPWAVDVSSGVESVRGEKSEKLVKDFIQAVERAEESV